MRKFPATASLVALLIALLAVLAGPGSAHAQTPPGTVDDYLSGVFSFVPGQVAPIVPVVPVAVGDVVPDVVLGGTGNVPVIGGTATTPDALGAVTAPATTGNAATGTDTPNIAGAANVPGTGDARDDDGGNTATIGIDVPDSENASNVVVIILLLSVLSIAPSILIMMTSFTRIVIVMSLTRNALGIPQLPPQQVIVGLSLFLSLFVMGPTLKDLNEVALQPLLSHEVSVTEAGKAAEGPMRDFMLGYTREAELELFLDANGTQTPVARDEVPLTALIPAFVLSELKSAFILGFLIFVPFLVIDLVVSAVLTSLGMMMMPPTFVSLPMKLLLFVMLDGWSLVVGTLLESYR